MTSRAVAIPVEDHTLEGLLEGPEAGPEVPGVVICHPHPAFGGTLHTPLVASLAAALVGRGMQVLRFNFRGIGASGGKGTGGLREDDDVRAACAWLRSQRAQQGYDLISIAGYSFGALMALKAIARGEPARRLAAIALPTAIVGDAPDRVADVQRGIERAPTLFVSGSADRLSSLSMVRSWVSALSPEVRATVLIDELPAVDHFPTGPQLEEVIARVVRFFTPPPMASERASERDSDGERGA